MLDPIDPWLARLVVLLSAAAILAIPARLHRGVKPTIARSRKGAREPVALAFTSLGFLFPLLWLGTGGLTFADYQLPLVVFLAGVLCLGCGLWVLHRSHKDLGMNWSMSLEIREAHELVTHGIYTHLRHPMYLALLLYSSGLALVVPNWVAGPSYLAAVVLLVALRVGPEERMMLQEFGGDYASYQARSKRLIRGVW